MKFTKMQGIGNDYVYIDCFSQKVNDPNNISRIVSNRHYGIGSDGLILISPSDTCDIQMRMFNVDGTEGEMCGNASRCVAKYVYDHDIARKNPITMETKGGKKILYVQTDDDDDKVISVTVDMGEPHITSKLPEKITIDGYDTEFVGVDVGNPHSVYYISTKEELDDLELEKIGPAYEHHIRFPERTNTEYIYVADRKNLYMRVWERGSGETLACGTGATSSAYASMLLDLCDDEVIVHLLGGDLKIRYDRGSNHLFMTGPCIEVFHGEINIEGEE